MSATTDAPAALATGPPTGPPQNPAGRLGHGRRRARRLRGRSNTRTSYVRPWRMVPVYPPFGAFGLRRMGIRSPRCSLSAGVHFMQVSKWLGHSSFVLMLYTYADYIREDDRAAPNLARPVADTTNVVERKKGRHSVGVERIRATRRRCCALGAGLVPRPATAD